MARERRQRPHGLLRRPGQRRRDDRLPRPGHPALAQVAQKAQPAPQAALDTDAPHRRALAASGPTHAPLPQRPFLRQHPRQEPGALTRTPGSARGAAGNGGPYRHAYVELHAHTAFSFLDGASSPAEFAAAAVELGHEAMAVTDHNGVSGSMEFAVAAQPLGLRAIHGVEIDLQEPGAEEGGAGRASG